MAYKENSHVFNDDDIKILKKLVDYGNKTYEEVDQWAKDNDFDPSDVDHIFSYIEYELEC